MDANTELPVVCGAPTRFVAMNGCIPGTQPNGKLPLMNLDYLTFDENNKPHPKSQELFYEALKTGPLFYSDLQAKVQSLQEPRGKICLAASWSAGRYVQRPRMRPRRQPLLLGPYKGAIEGGLAQTCR